MDCICRCNTLLNNRQIEVEIQNLAPFEWAAEAIAELMINTIKDDRAETISTVILEILRQVVEGNPPPPPPPAAGFQIGV